MRFALHFLLLAASLAVPSLGQTAADFFDPKVLHDIKIYMHPNDWATLREKYLENTFYPAEMDWRNLTVTGIGVRSRGLGSRDNLKPGLRVDINRYRNDQRFLGLRSFILDNVVQDISYVRERLSFWLFEQLNVPAPRQSFARLFVNDRYWGVYSIVEEVDKEFLKRRLGEDDGWLYEYKWADNYYYQDLGEEPEPYLDRFNPKTNETNSQIGMLQGFFRFINKSDDEQFFAEIGNYIEVEAYLRFVAVECYLAESDGQLGDEGTNNFYLYRKEKGWPLVWIAWDKDVTMHQFDRLLLTNWDRNVLFHRLISHKPYRDQFLAAVREAAMAAGGVGGPMLQLFESTVTQIRAAVHLDQNTKYSPREFEDSIDGLREYISLREQTVIGELESLRMADQVSQ